jgi:hypothetical protein
MLAVCVAVLAAGCERSEVSQVELEVQAEEVTALLLSAAEGVPRYQDDIVLTGVRNAKTSVEDPWRYWQVDGDLVLADDSPTSPPQVRDEMMRRLRADGWSEDDRNDAISGGAETFRKQDLGGVWTVQLGAWGSPPPSAQRVYFWVVSPSVDH